jgi:hypothetical protein
MRFDVRAHRKAVFLGQEIVDDDEPLPNTLVHSLAP